MSREGLTANQFYEWKRQLLSSSETVLGKRESKSGSWEERLEQENVRLKSGIAEIAAENLDLKKTLGDYEDHDPLSSELQSRVHGDVWRTREWSG